MLHLVTQAFVKEMSTAIGVQLQTPSNWLALPAEAAASSSSSGAEAPANTINMHAAESIEQMKDMGFQAHKLGFIVGANLLNKQAEQAEVWQITSVGADCATITKMVEGHALNTKQVQWPDIVEHWKVHKGKITSIVDLGVGSPVASSAWHLECLKGAVAIALRFKTGEYQHCMKQLEMLQHPTMVRTIANIPKGTLKLVPSTQKIEKSKSLAAEKNTVPVGTFDINGLGDVMLQLAPHFTPRLDSKGVENKAPWVAPFWAVQHADDKNGSNLVLQHEHVDIAGFDIPIPVLTNPKPIKAGEILLWDKNYNANKVEQQQKKRNIT